MLYWTWPLPLAIDDGICMRTSVKEKEERRYPEIEIEIEVHRSMLRMVRARSRTVVLAREVSSRWKREKTIVWIEGKHWGHGATLIHRKGIYP